MANPPFSSLSVLGQSSVFLAAATRFQAIRLVRELGGYANQSSAFLIFDLSVHYPFVFSPLPVSSSGVQGDQFILATEGSIRF